MQRFLCVASEASGGFFGRAARWLLNFDYDKIKPGDEVRFAFLGAPHGWGLLATIVCVAALIWLTFWLYRREGKTASRGRKLFLAVVRTAAVLLALLMFLEPALVVSKLYETPSPVVLLLDVSESMTIKDHYADQKIAEEVAEATGQKSADVLDSRLARQDVINGVLNNPQLDLINRLAAKNPVHVYGFGDACTKLFSTLGAEPDANPGEGAAKTSGRYNPGDLKIAAASGRTYVGRAVSKILENPGGEPLAGVIVMSDFQDNDSDLDATAAAGKYAAREGVPIYGVPVGLSYSVKTKNLKVDKSLRTNRTLFVGDPAEFVALVSSTGYETRRCQAELLRRKAGAAREERIATEEVVIKAGASNQPVSLTHTPLEGDEGEYVYTIRIAPQDDEHLKQDNTAVASGIRVAKTLTNVLLISGSPTWEYRNLRNLLIHDKTVVLSCWLQGTSKAYPQVGNRLLTKLPMTDEEIFDPKDGPHVIILVDIDPTDFSLEWFQRIEKFVREHAGGLLYVAGEKKEYTFELLEKRSISAPLVGMLPVVFDLAHAEVCVGAGPKGYRPHQLVPTEDGLQSPLLRFSTERELTEKVWQTLPGSVWSFPIKDAKRGATVLMRTMDKSRAITIDGKSAPMPVFVTSFYGKGRVAFMAFDETWRWRTLNEGRVYDTFWTQTVRSLVEGRLLGGEKSVVLETDSETYPLAAPVTVSVKVYDSGGKPSTQPGVDVKVEMTAGADEDDSAGVDPPMIVKLPPVPNAPGAYRREFVPRRTGYYKLSVVGTGEDSLAATTNIEVASQFEFDHPEMNRARLAELIDPSTGGRVVELRELRSLPDVIESKKKQVFEAGRPDALWANPLCLGLMALLLGVEWAVRKRSNMA